MRILTAKLRHIKDRFRKLLGKIKQVKFFNLGIKDITPVKDTGKTFLNFSNGGRLMKNSCFYAKKNASHSVIPYEGINEP